MARDLKLQSGKNYLPSYNWEIGMNDDVAYSDRSGYSTSVEAALSGIAADWDDMGGLEVGNQYDLDPMSEERSDTTFSQGVPRAKGKIGMMGVEGGASMQATQRTVGGKSVDLETPQTYNSIDVGKK